MTMCKHTTLLSLQMYLGTTIYLFYELQLLYDFCANVIHVTFKRRNLSVVVKELGK